jgi:hypothetical protein
MEWSWESDKFVGCEADKTCIKSIIYLKVSMMGLI